MQTKRQVIPGPVMSVCAEIIARRETNAKLESLFIYAGAPSEPIPLGSKLDKAMEWLRVVNKNESINPLSVLGLLIENYIDIPCSFDNDADNIPKKDKEKIENILSKFELQYVRGGSVVGSMAAPSRNLEVFIRDRDIAAIELEFNRAIKNVELNPREAVSAASNILESLCKVYIDDEGLEKPAKLDLKPVWEIVRKHLGLDPSKLEDNDLKTILTGLIAIVDGIGALRTHASSAHGAGRKSYKLEPRHARLAIHAAHTVTLFVLETWQKKKENIN